METDGTIWNEMLNGIDALRDVWPTDTSTMNLLGFSLFLLLAIGGPIIGARIIIAVMRIVQLPGVTKKTSAERKVMVEQITAFYLVGPIILASLTFPFISELFISPLAGEVWPLKYIPYPGFHIGVAIIVVIVFFIWYKTKSKYPFFSRNFLIGGLAGIIINYIFWYGWEKYL